MNLYVSFFNACINKRFSVITQIRESQEIITIVTHGRFPYTLSYEISIFMKYYKANVCKF